MGLLKKIGDLFSKEKKLLKYLRECEKHCAKGEVKKAEKYLGKVEDLWADEDVNYKPELSRRITRIRNNYYKLNL